MKMAEAAAGALDGIGVLVTRPAHQAASLSRAIESLGGTVYPFPVMEIVPPDNIEPARALFRDLSDFDTAIFISANAARIGVELMLEEGVIPHSLQFAAVGHATARTLEKLGYPAEILPTERFDSEGLLATPELQNVDGSEIVIVRGEGGRELLAETLRRRGASVTYAEIYRRIVPDSDPAPILEGWRGGGIDAAVVTSNQSLKNLMQMVGEAGRPYLLKTPLIVISERTREVAMELGFHHKAILAQPPSDAAILDTLIHWVTDDPAYQKSREQ